MDIEDNFGVVEQLQNHFTIIYTEEEDGIASCRNHFVMVTLILTLRHIFPTCTFQLLFYWKLKGIGIL